MDASPDEIVLTDPITGRRFIVDRIALLGECGFGEDGFLRHSECDTCRAALQTVRFVDERPR